MIAVLVPGFAVYILRTEYSGPMSTGSPFDQDTTIYRVALQDIRVSQGCYSRSLVAELEARTWGKSFCLSVLRTVQPFEGCTTAYRTVLLYVVGQGVVSPIAYQPQWSRFGYPGTP